MEHRFFDFDDIAPAERYRLMANAVTPRPVAFVTTLSPEGVANAAPFSFFGLLSHDPATLAIGIEPRPDGRRKDTARNIIETGAFTVHIADAALAAQMDACGAPVEPEVDEIALAGLATVPGQAIPVPRLAVAPVAMECRLHSLVPLGPARDIVLGTIHGFFLRRDAITAAGHVDQDVLDIIGRVGGAAYATTRDRFRP
ncbi:flavin reductase family protein [Paracoccus fontiphilus]|uniref:Flavin reductase family protein n=1 Tax=Paracoccus fontiphilus TaxID=1815556 RepID=A0ABV7IB13_9RHOB|nr:flavin reductase family protein [Paracoccus fontiphilus]